MSDKQVIQFIRQWPTFKKRAEALERLYGKNNSGMQLLVWTGPAKPKQLPDENVFLWLESQFLKGESWKDLPVCVANGKEENHILAMEFHLRLVWTNQDAAKAVYVFLDEFGGIVPDEALTQKGVVLPISNIMRGMMFLVGLLFDYCREYVIPHTDYDSIKPLFPALKSGLNCIGPFLRKRGSDLAAWDKVFNCFQGVLADPQKARDRFEADYFRQMEFLRGKNDPESIKKRQFLQSNRQECVEFLDVWSVEILDKPATVLNPAVLAGKLPASSSKKKLAKDIGQKVWDYLDKHPNATARKVAEAMNCSPATVSKMPAWKQCQSERKKQNPPKPKAVAYSPDQDAFVINRSKGNDEKELMQLIEEQEKDHELSPLDPSRRKVRYKKQV